MDPKAAKERPIMTQKARKAQQKFLNRVKTLEGSMVLSWGYPGATLGLPWGPWYILPTCFTLVA